VAADGAGIGAVANSVMCLWADNVCPQHWKNY